jgi:hypothetical protein
MSFGPPIDNRPMDKRDWPMGAWGTELLFHLTRHHPKSHRHTSLECCSMPKEAFKRLRYRHDLPRHEDPPW